MTLPMESSGGEVCSDSSLQKRLKFYLQKINYIIPILPYLNGITFDGNPSKTSI